MLFYIFVARNIFYFLKYFLFTKWGFTMRSLHKSSCSKSFILRSIFTGKRKEFYLKYFGTVKDMYDCAFVNFV